ncbi:MAG: glycosyltransferase [Bacteroidota bacterium]
MSSLRVPLLFLSDIPWYSLHQRPQHLALRLAKHRNVLWVEPATLGHMRSWKPERVGGNVHRISIPLLPHNARNAIVKLMAWIASRIPGVFPLLTVIQHRLLQRALRQLGYDGSPIPVLIENFQLIKLVEALPTSVVCFDYIDDAFGFVDLPDYVRDLWKQTIERSNVITVTTPQLREQIGQVRSGNTHVIQNGVEYSHFAQENTRRPDDLPASGIPIAGYVGSVYPWFDFDLLERAARELPGVNFVIIGPQHPDIAGSVEKMKGIANVLFLGLKPYTLIPAYLHHFTVGLIPFVRNKLTEAVNPVKLYEYSAAGLPTVTTFFSDDLQQFKDLVHVATSADDFIRALPRAIEERSEAGSIARLRAFGRENDWNARAAEVQAIMNL